MGFQTQIDWSVYRQACLHRQTVTGLVGNEAISTAPGIQLLF